MRIRRAAAILVVLLALAAPAPAPASAAALNLTGTWSAVYHCEVGCAGSSFPATDKLTQTEGSSAVTGSNGSEEIRGTLVGSRFEYHSSTGGYKAEGTLTISPDGQSWTGQVHDNNGTSGTYTATRQGRAPAAAAPLLAVSGDIAPVSGTVLVRLPGATAFTTLSALSKVPFGATIDATAGRVKVTTAAPHRGLQTGEFFEGEFVLSQARSGLVQAKLAGGEPGVCQAPARAARAAAKKPAPRRIVRKLWANAHGSFSTRGNYAAGAVAGTEWLTEDLCEGTLIRVTRDKVKVTNLRTHRRLIVHAGHRYLARA